MNKLYLLLFFIVFTSCKNNSSIIGKGEIERYNEIREMYPSSFVDHFQELSEGSVRSLRLRFPRGRYLNGIELVISLSIEKKKEIEEFAKKNAVEIHDFNDSLLIIQAGLGSNPINQLQVKEVSENTFRGLPIPNFKNNYKNVLHPIFYEDAIIYVLEAKTGIFLPENQLSVNGVSLPTLWEHGYTKGIVIGKEDLIYWLNVW